MSAVRTILCPVDFSEASGRQVDLAAALARAYGARVVLFHSRETYVSPLADLPPGWVMPAAQIEAEVKAIASRLGERAADLRRAGVTVVERIVEGHPVAAILEAVRAESADLVVIATHGRRGFERMLLGSVTEKILRKAPCPVLTVPPAFAGAAVWPPAGGVVCGVDFSPSSRNALTHAATIARNARVPLTVVHVVEVAGEEDIPELAHFNVPEFRRAVMAEARERLDAVVRELGADPAPEAVLVGGKACRHVLDVAAKRHAGLVVVGATGKNVAERALLGSAASEIVRAATCPVLTVRGAG